MVASKSELRVLVQSEAHDFPSFLRVEGNKFGSLHVSIFLAGTLSHVIWPGKFTTSLFLGRRGLAASWSCDTVKLGSKSK